MNEWEALEELWPKGSLMLGIFQQFSVSFSSNTAIAGNFQTVI